METELSQVDYNLLAALQENGHSCVVGEIVEVLATIEGENDGADWHWLVLLDEGFAYVTGGCDYTGWD